MEIFEKILNSKKVKYDVLRKIIPKEDVFPPELDKNATKFIDIYIDVDSIWSNLYQANLLDAFKVLPKKDRFLFSSDLLNLVGHLRHFYCQAGFYSTIYLMYTTKLSSHITKCFPEYKNEWYEKRTSSADCRELNKILGKNIDATKTIVDYVPHVYLMKCAEIDPLYLPYVAYMNREDKPNLSLIVSNNPLFVQYVNVPTFRLLEAKGDRSKYVTEFEAMNFLAGKEDGEFNHLKSDLIGHAIAMAGYKKYNIEGIPRYANLKAIKLLDKLLKEDKMRIIKCDNFESLIETFPDVLKNKTIAENKDKILLCDQVLNIFNFFRSLPDSIVMDQFKHQLIDFSQGGRQVRYLNDEYYSDHPINLEFLFDGEEE